MTRIIGGGFMTHNLRLMRMGPNASGLEVPTWSSEFDSWANEHVGERDIDALLDFQHKAPAARLAHPTTDHFVPLFVSLGAVIDRPYESKTVIDGFLWGLSKRSFELATPARG